MVYDIEYTDDLNIDDEDLDAILKDKADKSESFIYKHEQLCQEIVAKYLGPPSENCRPDFLKIPEHSKGLELDIPYLL
ncbi:hypothetical protein GLOIN_2v1791328 [Rhizophagus irregularis DAOM 181602=DAOM 197198]|uniref:Uncharacterized protein n=1 Tax=Rhizophagus irregularis (strain DAOM 181602 / DAOM 197198 / MUCL 43194) TaxID=747089 RepID=A0A2P4NXC0_RHIID|nr:hypothetical protein GLOIN_2v1791328 [Rhizophagus irregularis DAOM 181602=DAOM 197198]POG57763.1 hypothetical protein GLOIN_2v1791328 [Rhizophagus irregularis DAOM 181602=DAOM 197198]GET54291.1 hypothetical protein GLOIN_2v1791328 [Rhizophagus irregularis DAOM 181602=DAOM 197198]|eukprot:XP_025164629.1 hypothetical protein GLOIN_2v1791328 [Rhizophagus irregularis DAOM 181602=DAOM 197198]